MPDRPKGGVKPDQMFCYDLEVPEDFEPIPVDGEVESFQLMPTHLIFLKFFSAPPSLCFLMMGSSNSCSRSNSLSKVQTLQR